MAEMTVEVGVKREWWVRPAAYVAWLIFPFSERIAERYVTWIVAKGLTPYVR